jgi:hypothetical protein
MPQIALNLREKPLADYVLYGWKLDTLWAVILIIQGTTCSKYHLAVWKCLLDDVG